MAKEFKSLKSFATHLRNNVIDKYDKREKALLTMVGIHIVKESKSIIGVLQHGAFGGVYGHWPELAEATQAEKERLGYGDVSNDWQPLLRTGELRDSIGYSVQLHSVYIGSTSDIMVYQEMGTAHIPPRPVLGLAMYRDKFKIHKSINNFMYAWITDTKAQGKVHD
jgi:hypothetical protein